MKERKAQERERARAARRAIAPEVRRRKEAAIRASLEALPEVEGALVLGAYVSVHSEVDTRGFLADLLAAGRRVAIPVVTPPEHMVLAELATLDDLIPGAHGIPEPKPPRTFLDDADAILVPGLVFTPDGHRLGYGGGYFDRLLAEIPGAVRIGVAFEEQVARKLPIEAHDEPLDILVTDARVLRFPRLTRV